MGFALKFGKNAQKSGNIDRSYMKEQHVCGFCKMRSFSYRIKFYDSMAALLLHHITPLLYDSITHHVVL